MPCKIGPFDPLISSGLTSSSKPDLEALFMVPFYENTHCKCGKKRSKEKSLFFTPQWPRNDGSDSNHLKNIVTTVFSREYTGTTCNTCNQERTSYKVLARAPEVIMIKLNRIVTDRGKVEKVQESVKFGNYVHLPPQCFDKKWTKSREQVDYELMTIQCHEGDDTNSGHYFTIARGPDHRWYFLNDLNPPEEIEDGFRSLGNVRLINSVFHTGYVYTYRRIDMDIRKIVQQEEEELRKAWELEAEKARKEQELETERARKEQEAAAKISPEDQALIQEKIEALAKRLVVNPETGETESEVIAKAEIKALKDKARKIRDAWLNDITQVKKQKAKT